MEPSGAACRLDCTYPRFTLLPLIWPHAPIAPAANNRSLLVYWMVIQTRTNVSTLGCSYKQTINHKIPRTKLEKERPLKESVNTSVDTHQGSPGREAVVYTRLCKTFETGPDPRCPEAHNIFHPGWGHPSHTLYLVNLEIQGETAWVWW